ncbi:MAG: tetratricopeptide repeat protein [Bacteroidales bacterium]
MLGSVIIGPAQTERIEELKTQIESTVPNGEKLKLLNSISSLYLDVDPREGLIYGRQAVDLATRLDDDEQLARANRNLGHLYFVLNLPDSALYYLKPSYTYFKEQQNQENLFQGANLLGLTFNDIPNFDSGIHYLSIAKNIAQLKNDSIKLASIYVNIGSMYQDQSKLQQAFDYYIRATEVYERLGQNKDLAIVLNNMALIYIDQENYHKAILLLKRASRLNEKIGDRVNLSINFSNLGICYKEILLYDSAIATFNRSLEIAGELNLTHDLARNYLNLGNVYIKLKKFEEARKSYQISLDYSNRMNLEMGRVYNHLAMASLGLETGELHLVEQSLDEVYETVIETGILRLHLDALWFYVRLMKQKGDYRAASEYQDLYMNLKDSMQNLARTEQLEALQAKYESEKKEAENLQLRAENQYSGQVIRNQQLIGIGIFIVLILVTLLAFTFFRSRQKLRRAFDIMKDLNRKIGDQNRELEKVNQTKDRLFSLIAHDLRSPFNTISGFLELLIEEYDDYTDEKKKDILETVHQQSINTYGLLENLLQWSSTQRDMIDPEPRNIQVQKLVDEQLDLLSVRIHKKQISIEKDINPGSIVHTDYTMTMTILRNLINNAIKFSYPAGTITISSTTYGSYVRIDVRDEGVGMSQDLITEIHSGKRIYPSSGTENEKGAGLGIEIVKDFVKQNRGYFEIASEPKKGTTFSVFLPEGENSL